MSGVVALLVEGHNLAGIVEPLHRLHELVIDLQRKVGLFDQPLLALDADEGPSFLVPCVDGQQKRAFTRAALGSACRHFVIDLHEGDDAVGDVVLAYR